MSEKSPVEKSFHITPEKFRHHGHAAINWIADYYQRIESLPVVSQVEPGHELTGVAG